MACVGLGAYVAVDNTPPLRGCDRIDHGVKQQSSAVAVRCLPKEVHGGSSPPNPFARLWRDSTKREMRYIEPTDGPTKLPMCPRHVGSRGEYHIPKPHGPERGVA